MSLKCAYLVFLSCFSPLAFAQSVGIVQCSLGDSKPVPAFTAPGKPHILAQLSCGQTVRILGVDRSFSPLSYSSRPAEYLVVQVGSNSAYVDPQFIRRLNSEEIADITISEQKPSPANEPPPPDKEQQKWVQSIGDSLKVSNETLLKPIILNGSTYLRGFRATVKNTNPFPISHLRLQVRIYDCAGKAMSDFSNCEIVSEANPVAAVPLPAGQTRSIEVSAAFDTKPRVKGTMAWNYQILGARAE